MKIVGKYKKWRRDRAQRARLLHWLKCPGCRKWMVCPCKNCLGYRTKAGINESKVRAMIWHNDGETAECPHCHFARNINWWEEMRIDRVRKRNKWPHDQLWWERWLWPSDFTLNRFRK